MNGFCHLHTHSAFSPQWGIFSPAELCSRVRTLGMRHLALTDRNGLYGIPHFLEQAAHAGIKPIIGAEAAINGERAVLLAHSGEGYANLCRLLSELHCREDFHLAKALIGLRQGLIIFSDQAAILTPLARHSRADLYVEISPGHRMDQALELARRLQLPPLATSRAVFASKEQFQLHRVMRAIALNTKLSRLPGSEIAAQEDRLFSPQSLADFFPHCPEALENSLLIAERCKTDWDFSQVIFPTFQGLSQEEAYRELERRSREGVLRRYGKNDVRIEKRLRKELDIIRSKGFAHYFLVVRELAGRSLYTCGRGSAAASLVAYALGITQVDPIRHNLFFERFLNPGRIDPPDIDIDFPWDERDAVLDYAFERHGTERAAMVATHIGFKGRSALREVAKVHGLCETEIKSITSRISGYCKADQLIHTLRTHPLFQGTRLSPGWAEILAISQQLEGKLRHLALHCGGVIIVPEEIRRHVPVEISVGGRPVIQWEKDQAESSGLVKIDILGNRSLAVIRDAVQAIHSNTGLNIDYAAWKPLDDPATCKLLRSGETIGCFYIESPATRQLLKKMWGRDKNVEKHDLFEHLVMASSIIRPASNTFIREFVARMHGKTWTSLHPLLKEVLSETYGIAVYQEQITQMAMALADFSASEAEQLRKIVSKKEKTQRLEDYQRLFFAGGERKGIRRETLHKTWEQILSFSGYSFCKPHSASYALVSCKCAWLKSHFPAEFMAAVICHGGGFYSTQAYLSECRRLGLRIQAPDINTSREEYQGRGKSIRIGLQQIQGLSRQVPHLLREERRRKGDFKDFADFLRRVPCDRSDCALLVKAGCFDSLDGQRKRPELLWKLLENSSTAKAQSGFLFVGDTPEPSLSIPVPTKKQLLRQEVETLGLLASCHPLQLYPVDHGTPRRIQASELHHWVGKQVTLTGWWVTGKTVQTRQDQPMEFISFEDETAIFETVFFPKAYARFCRKLGQNRPYILRGRAEEEFGVVTVNVEWLDFMDRYQKKSPSSGATRLKGFSSSVKI
jgi:DNA-directed DNA polymerase III PolC